MPFIQEILNEKKNVILSEDKIELDWPQYKEFSVQNFWTHVGDDAKILSYLPNRDDSAKPIDKKFAYNILSTLRPGYCKEVIKNAINKRTGDVTLRIKPDQVTISNKMLKILTEVPFKHGKLSDMLY